MKKLIVVGLVFGMLAVGNAMAGPASKAIADAWAARYSTNNLALREAAYDAAVASPAPLNDEEAGQLYQIAPHTRGGRYGLTEAMGWFPFLMDVNMYGGMADPATVLRMAADFELKTDPLSTFPKTTALATAFQTGEGIREAMDGFGTVIQWQWDNLQSLGKSSVAKLAFEPDLSPEEIARFQRTAIFAFGVEPYNAWVEGLR